MCVACVYAARLLGCKGDGIANPDLFACRSRTWMSLDISAFMRSIASHPAGPHCRLAQKNDNRAPIAGGGRGRHNLHRVCQTTVTAPLCIGGVVWSQHSHHNIHSPGSDSKESLFIRRKAWTYTSFLSG